MSRAKAPALGTRHRLLHPPNDHFSWVAVVTGVESKWINLTWDYGGVSS